MLYVYNNTHNDSDAGNPNYVVIRILFSFMLILEYVGVCVFAFLAQVLWRARCVA